jgi:hypothetical protein
MKTYPRQRAKPSPKIKEGYPYKFYCQYWTEKILNSLK